MAGRKVASAGSLGDQSGRGRGSVAPATRLAASAALVAAARAAAALAAQRVQQLLRRPDLRVHAAALLAPLLGFNRFKNVARGVGGMGGQTG